MDEVIKIQGVLMNGGSCVVSAKDYETTHISGMVMTARNSGANLTIKDAEYLDSIVVGGISANGDKNIVLDFSNS